MAIPKTIHYCWFGGKPLPKLAIKCINSWKKFCPDYEIKLWNEENFDINACEYVKEAYEAKKWAFVSDFARFKILYEHGGVYFDTDVELLKPIEDIIQRGGFMAAESFNPTAVAPGLGLAVNPGLGLAVNPGLGLYKELIDGYYKRHFKNEDGSFDYKTVVTYTTEILSKHGLQNKNSIQQVAGIYIYPTEYFCPINYATFEMTITDKTRSIHHFAGTWLSKEAWFAKKLSICLNKHTPKLLGTHLVSHLAYSTAIIKYRGIKALIAKRLKQLRLLLSKHAGRKRLTKHCML